jgi:hypothetical protein
LPEGLTDEALEVRLCPPPAVAAAKDRRQQPDWVVVHRKARYENLLDIGQERVAVHRAAIAACFAVGRVARCVDRLFNRRKQFRRIATRLRQIQRATFMAFIQLAPVRISFRLN